MLTKTDSDTARKAGKAFAPNSYEAARYHSARVQRLKVILPLGALFISLIFIAVSVIRSYVPDSISVLGTKIEDGKIVMEKPVAAGRNQQGINYSVTADRALQDIRDPNNLTLEAIKAAVPLNDKIIARVTAARGEFDRSSDKLNMTAPFTVDLSTGLTAQLQSAQVDVKAGTLFSNDPVTIRTEEGSIVANSLNITDKGHTIVFSGNVKVNTNPVATRNRKQQSGPND